MGPNQPLHLMAPSFYDRRANREWTRCPRPPRVWLQVFENSRVSPNNHLSGNAYRVAAAIGSRSATLKAAFCRGYLVGASRVPSGTRVD